MALALGLAGAAFIALTWVGYPLAIAAVAALRSRRAPIRSAGTPLVTCVLAARETPAVIEARVKNWLDSDYAGVIDVVVALEPGPDATWAPPTDLATRVRVVPGDAPGGKCANLNAGVRAARGEVLVFGDAHQLFARDAIRRLVDTLADPRVGAVSGQLEIPRDRAGFVAHTYWRYERWLRRGEAVVHSTVGVTGAIYAMRAVLWRPLPAGLILDDVHVPMRLVLEGHRVGFAERAIATETRTVVAAQEYRRKVRTLTGNFQLCVWLPSILVPGRNPIWAQFVLHKLCRLFTPYALALAAGGALVAALERWWPLPPLVVGAVGVTALWLAASPDAVARRARAAASQFLVLQAATVVALWNAVRGRWDVWQPHARHGST